MGCAVVPADVLVGHNERGNVSLGQAQRFTIAVDIGQGNIERVAPIGAGQKTG